MFSSFISETTSRQSLMFSSAASFTDFFKEFEPIYPAPRSSTLPTFVVLLSELLSDYELESRLSKI